MIWSLVPSDPLEKCQAIGSFEITGRASERLTFCGIA